MTDETMTNCPFCQPTGALMENDLAYVIEDAYPVNPGHLLIIPKSHVADFFLITEAERSAMLKLLDEAKHHLDRKHAPAGYNIGVNVGDAAGQTVPHVHMHLIPRYPGDTPNPRGGVRGVIPDKQNY